MFSRILFPTDFSSYAKKALDCIAGFPRVRDIVLLHVVEEARSPRGGGEIGDAFFSDEKRSLKEEKRYLESLERDLNVKAEVKISSDIAGAILETAEEQGVSLIVIGARGKSLVEGILLGSVSMAVLRRSRTTVLIMRHKLIEGLTGKTYELICPRILSKILCPIDFSQYSNYAISLVEETENAGEVILLHVVSSGETEDAIEAACRDARDQLETIRVNLLARGIRASAILRRGDPSTEIVRAAEEEEVSLIWLSSHGTGWFRELLLGSTANAVAVNAKRPVIIIRKPE